MISPSFPRILFSMRLNLSPLFIVVLSSAPIFFSFSQKASKKATGKNACEKRSRPSILFFRDLIQIESRELVFRRDGSIIGRNPEGTGSTARALMDLRQIIGFDLQLNGIRRRCFSRDFLNGRRKHLLKGPACAPSFWLICLFYFLENRHGNGRVSKSASSP